MPHTTTFAKSQGRHRQSVSQSGWTHSLRPEASTGAVCGGFGC
jgi:hypothetical protein